MLWLREPALISIIVVIQGTESCQFRNIIQVFGIESWSASIHPFTIVCTYQVIDW